MAHRRIAAGQGVDPNALQNQVATIANQMFDAAQAKVKLIARIFAETGIRDLFSLAARRCPQARVAGADGAAAQSMGRRSIRVIGRPATT